MATSQFVIVTSSSPYFSPSNVGLRLRAVDAYDNILGEIKITAYTSSTIIVGSVSTVFTAPTYSAGYWGISAKTISGLNQLEQSSVVALGDGVPVPSSYVVSNGTITLPSDYYVLTAGLQCVQTLMTLPKEEGAERGTAQGKKQRINNIGFKLNNSYTGFYVSGTTGTLQQVVISNSTLYSGVIPNITFSDDYRYGSQVLIVNTAPLPVEILSIMADLETFEK